MTGHSIHPHAVDKSTWFYDYAGGIIVVHEVRDPKTGAYIQTDQIKIKWPSIIAAAERHKQETKK